MDHTTVSPLDRRLPPERAPLTRLRTTTRPVPLVLPDPPAGWRHLLPDGRIWAQLFGGNPLPAVELAGLNDVARARRVAASSLVFERDQIARALVLVSDGDVALGVRTEDGGFRTEHHRHGPAWLDASAGCLGEPHALDARAMTDATVVDLPREPLLALLDRAPALARRLVVSLAREARGLAVNTHDLMHKDAPARLAAWLRSQCVASDADANQGVVLLPMRKRDIASQLAITPETLSRLMRSFSSQGVIRVAGYTVHVLDVSGLSALAQG